MNWDLKFLDYHWALLFTSFTRAWPGSIFSKGKGYGKNMSPNKRSYGKNIYTNKRSKIWVTPELNNWNQKSHIHAFTLSFHLHPPNHPGKNSRILLKLLSETRVLKLKRKEKQGVNDLGAC